MNEVQNIIHKGVCVECKGKISMVDGKIVTWITKTKSHRRCAICQELPNTYRGRVEFAFDVLSLEAIDQLCCTILHYGLNSFQHLFKLACRIRIGCTTWNVPSALSDAYKEAEEYFKKRFYDDTKLRVNCVNPSGGTSTTGNVVS